MRTHGLEGLVVEVTVFAANPGKVLALLGKRGVGAEEQCGGSVGGKVPLPAIALMYLILVLQSEMSTR